jgi:hypothetical protein
VLDGPNDWHVVCQSSEASTCRAVLKNTVRRALNTNLNKSAYDLDP